MRKIYFTEDIREDILLGGLTISEFFRILLVTGGALLAIFFLPLPFLFKLVFFGIPAVVTAAAIFLGLPSILKKNRLYRKEPKVYEGKKLDAFFPVETAHPPCFRTKKGEWLIFLEAYMKGWEHALPEEQDAMVWTGFQSILHNLTAEGAGVMIFVEDDKHLPVEEWTRQTEELDKGRSFQGLEEIGRARLALHREGAVQGQSRRVSYLIRISLDRSKEKEEDVREKLIYLARQTITDLTMCSISSMILSNVSSNLQHQYTPSVWRQQKLGVEDMEESITFSIQPPPVSLKTVTEEEEKTKQRLFHSLWVAIKEKGSWLMKLGKRKKSQKEEIDPVLTEEEILQRISSPIEPFDSEEESMEEEVFSITAHETDAIVPMQGSPQEAPIVPRGGLFVYVSRAPTGKTFVSFNTAVLLSRTQSTSLIDLDIPNRGLHTWANLPEQEQGLLTLFQQEGSRGYSPSYATDLTIYGLDPDVEVEKITSGMMETFWTNLMELKKKQVVVVDVPFTYPYVQTLCEMADEVYALFDSNYHHFRQWRRDWKLLCTYCEPVMIWNQREEGLTLPFSEEFGHYPAVSIPRLEGVQQSLFKGRPYVLQPEAEKEYFEMIE